MARLVSLRPPHAHARPEFVAPARICTAGQNLYRRPEFVAPVSRPAVAGVSRPPQSKRRLKTGHYFSHAARICSAGLQTGCRGGLQTPAEQATAENGPLFLTRGENLYRRSPDRLSRGSPDPRRASDGSKRVIFPPVEGFREKCGPKLLACRKTSGHLLAGCPLRGMQSLILFAGYNRVDCTQKGADR